MQWLKHIVQHALLKNEAWTKHNMKQLIQETLNLIIIKPRFFLKKNKNKRAKQLIYEKA